MTEKYEGELVGVCVDKVIEGMEPWQYTAPERDAKSVMSALESLPDRQRLAIITAKKWPKRKLTVAFLDGERKVQNKVKRYAKTWSSFAKVNLSFVAGTNADIRIAFEEGDGSWSYIGTDAISIDHNEPTMNFGWLTEESADKEYSRVVIHEFGHALGSIHEHQNPSANIPWKKEAVYAELGGPPNNWSKEQVDHNLFARYSKTITQFTAFDPNSIMLYPIPARWTTNNQAIGGDNSELSKSDKDFIKIIYP
jgi:serralysin